MGKQNLREILDTLLAATKRQTNVKQDEAENDELLVRLAQRAHLTTRWTETQSR